MPISPTFNGYSLQSSTVILENINFRTRAKRSLDLQVLTRRSGTKRTNQQLIEKVVTLSGHIIASTQDELQTTIDELMRECSAIDGSLVIETGRTFIATAESIDIPDRPYSQTKVEWSISFVVPLGYAEGTTLEPVCLLPSGTNPATVSLTISGSASNRPSFTFVLPGSSGTSNVSKIELTNNESGNSLTVSGVWARGSQIVADFDNYQTTVSGIAFDFIGTMEEINPGTRTFSVTASGANDGIQVKTTYSPRYF